MKKLISLLLATMLVLSCLSGLCFAADPVVSYTANGVTKEGSVADATKAITAAKGGEIKLLKDLTFKDPDGDPTKDKVTYGLALSQKLDLVIDLNGHTINSEGIGIWLGVYDNYGTPGATTVIKNGTILSYKQAVSLCNGGLVMENVKAYSQKNQVVDFYDYSGQYNATNRIENCTLISGVWGALCFQKGVADNASNATAMTIKNSILVNTVGDTAIVANSKGEPTVILGEGVQLMTVKAKATLPVGATITVTGETATKSDSLGTATVADKTVKNLNLWTTPATATKPVEVPTAPAETPAAPAGDFLPVNKATAIWYNETESKETTLAEAAKLASEKGGIIKMTSNAEHTDEKVGYAFTTKSSFTLDLNGHTLKSVTRGFSVGKEATGITLVTDTKGGGAIHTKLLNIYVNGGALHLNGVTLFSETQQNIGYTVTTGAYNDNNIIENSTVLNPAWGALAYNNAEASMKDVTFTIRNSTFGNVKTSTAVVFQKAAAGGTVVFGEGMKIYSKGTPVQVGLTLEGETPVQGGTEDVTILGNTFSGIPYFTTKAAAEAPAKPTLPEIPAPKAPEAPKTETPKTETPTAPAKPAEKPAETQQPVGTVTVQTPSGNSSANPLLIVTIVIGIVAVAAVAALIVVLKKKK